MESESKNRPNNKYRYGQYVISEDKKVIFQIDIIYVNGDFFTYGNEHLDGRFQEDKISLYKLNHVIE